MPNVVKSGIELVFDRRFEGPTDIANGGVVAGTVAETLGGELRVALRRPSPLDQPVTLVVAKAGRASLVKDGVTLVEAERYSIDLDVPEPSSLDEAREASARCPQDASDIYPGCFVCGKNRAEGDGLRILPGPLRDRRAMAAPWHVHESLDSGDGRVSSRFVWAALDCPSFYSTLLEEGVVPEQPILLGTLAVKVLQRPAVGMDCIVINWPLGIDGRKRRAGGALFSSGGDLLALAESLWVELRDSEGRE